MQPKRVDLTFGTAEGRWARFGPYYAMFPVPFAEQVITRFSRPGETVLDPFCGRGTAPYIAMVYGRNAIGCDVNPVAWIYSKTKTDPHPDESDVINRIREVRDAVTNEETAPKNEFQKLAFCKSVLGFINVARRELDWRSNKIDRTVSAILLQYLHDKKGAGLSNQLRHSRALAPKYCVRWWRDNGHDIPPEIEPLEFLGQRVAWRYAKGIPKQRIRNTPMITLGKASVSLPTTDNPAKLVLTSPPYSNVTNYRSDNWLRLWALGVGPDLPDWEGEQKFSNADGYRRMLHESFTATQARTNDEAIWYIRSDARSRTKDTISSVMAQLLPQHRAYELSAPYIKQTQTALYGDHEPKPGEVDLLYMPPNRRRRGFAMRFSRVAMPA